MPEQTVIWTALPNGSVERGGERFLRLSVLVSPRLDGGEALRLFPDFLRWPAAVARIRRWAVEIEGGPTIDANRVPSPALDPELWSAMFHGRTFVRPHRFDDYTQTLILSYPVREVLSSLQAIYGAVGFASPEGPPPRSREMTALLADLAIRVDAETAAELRRRMAVEQASGEHVVPERGLARLLLFHQTPDGPRVPLPETRADMERYVDFHQAISSLGEYPELMRRLGLVIDLELPAREIPLPTVDQPMGALRVTPSFQPVLADTRSVSPRTAFTREEDGFAAAPRPVSAPGQRPAIEGGMLVLDPAMFDLDVVDLDGAAIKLTDLAVNVLEGRVSSAALPSLRSAGISVARAYRAIDLHTALGAARDMNDHAEAGGDVLLHAEDLVRGHRPDVWDSRSGSWRSLCARRGVYRFARGIEVRHDDEGIVSMGVTSAPSDPSIPKAPGEMRLHESLIRWDGWSLAAPHPGKAVNRDPDPDAPVERPGNPAVTPFGLSTTFTAAPRSLPSLRYGASYRVRVRVVDLAGNSLSLAEAPDAAALPQDGALPYLRFDPVIAPAVVLRRPITPDTAPGESLERLVIRSYNDAPGKDGAPTAAVSDRHIAPPRTGERTAELHGMLDDASGRLETDPATYAMIRRKDEGSFHTVGDTPIEPAARIELPYLPDPLARGAALRDLPGAPDATVGRVVGGALRFEPLPGVTPRPGSAALVGFGDPSKWPDAEPFRIALREGDGPPTWSASARLLSIDLPKASVATVPLSSYLSRDDLRLMGAWEWMRDHVNALTRQAASDPVLLERYGAYLAYLVQRALEGGFWMLTPPRSLTLVHAVQQPIGLPAFTSLLAARGLGDTFATLLGAARVHGRSTARIDIQAEWEDPIDPLDAPRPEVLRGSAHVAELPIPDSALLATTMLVSAGRAVGEYDPAADRVDLLPGAAPQHELGDTKHRIIRYRAISTSRFREYFPAEAGLDFTRTSDVAIASVPSSARPAAPRVRYVVPTFGWNRQTTTNLVASERIGGGLRVYLERPWFSSGQGELLGVVLWPGDIDPVDRERFGSYITQWGMDPIWGSPATSSLPKLEDFPLAARTDLGRLSLAELPGLGFHVAAHPVGYDEARQLWYCDIELPAGDAYRPFVRLALARCQPDSVTGAHLSRVVLASYAQLAPDRTAILTYDPYEPTKLSLIVSGRTYDASQNLFGDVVQDRSFVEVSVEARRAGVGGDLGWEPAAGARVDVEGTPAPDELLWQGTVSLPSPRVAGRYRLVIREYESLFIDAPGPSEGGLPRPRRRGRLVYADVIEIG